MRTLKLPRHSPCKTSLLAFTNPVMMEYAAHETKVNLWLFDRDTLEDFLILEIFVDGVWLDWVRMDFYYSLLLGKLVWVWLLLGLNLPFKESAEEALVLETGWWLDLSDWGSEDGGQLEDTAVVHIDNPKQDSNVFRSALSWQNHELLKWCTSEAFLSWQVCKHAYKVHWLTPQEQILLQGIMRFRLHNFNLFS